MAIEKIDSSKCIGCGKCVESCVVDVLRMDIETKTAYIKYPEECVLCCWCVVECPHGAVEISAERHSPLFNSWG